MCKNGSIRPSVLKVSMNGFLVDALQVILMDLLVILCQIMKVSSSPVRQQEQSIGFFPAFSAYKRTGAAVLLVTALSS